MNREFFERLAAGYSSKATQVGGGGAVYGWITSNEALGVMGVVLAAAGLLVNWYYRREQNRREERRHAMEEREHLRRMEKMRTAPSPLEGEIE